MLDLKLIRDNPELVKKAMADRCTEAPVDEILSLDAERRKAVAEVENLRHTRREASKGQLDKSAIEEARNRRSQIKELEDRVSELDNSLRTLLLQIPNIPQPSVPIGKSEKDNPLVRVSGEPKTFDFTPLPHWTLGEKLGIIDFERGVKLSGTRFYVLRGAGARLQRALITFFLDLHTKGHGYT